MESKTLLPVLIGLTLLIFISALSPGITGFSIVDNPTLEYALSHTDEIQTKFNSRIEDVPGIVKFLLGNEKINLEIQKNDNSIKKLSITTNKGLIQEVTESQLEKYTMNAYITEQTINTILTSENQVDAAIKALQDKDIKLTGIGIWKKTKLTFSKIGIKVYGWFK